MNLKRKVKIMMEEIILSAEFCRLQDSTECGHINQEGRLELEAAVHWAHPPHGGGGTGGRPSDPLRISPAGSPRPMCEWNETELQLPT